MISIEKPLKYLILSMPYTFRLTLRSFYGNIKLAILVINTSKTFTNILMEPKISTTLLLKYLINAPLASKIRFQKIHLHIGPSVLPHNHIKVSQLILTSMG